MLYFKTLSNIELIPRVNKIPSTLIFVKILEQKKKYEKKIIDINKKLNIKFQNKYLTID